MIRRLELTIKTKLGLLATTLINTVLFFALVTSAQETNVLASNVPSVSTSGLIVHLDASDIVSYSGVGNQWVNLVDGSSYTIVSDLFDAANSGSIVFNGTSTYVSLGTPLAANTSYTKEAWVKTDVVSSSRNIISTNSSPLFLSNNILYGGIADSYTVVSSGSFPANQWKHVVLTFNHTTKFMTLYVDGIQVSQNTATNKSFTSQVVRVGAHGHPTTATTAYSFWDGNIAQVRIYNTTLSSQEVSENFHASKQAFIPLVDVDLSFESNQGEGSMSVVTAEEFSSITLPDNGFTRTGFVFDGWNDQSDGSGNAYSNEDSYTMGFQNTVLYAQWRPYRVIAMARPTIDNDNRDGFVLAGSINSFTSSGFTDSGVYLTTSTGQASSVFLDKQFSASADGGFSSYFVLDVREVNSVPADGFVFVIAANKNSLGAAGGGFGYGGISNSIGLEFDFYDNGGEPPIHIALHQNGVVQNAGFTTIDSTTGWGNNTDDRLFRRYHVWLDYDQATSGLSVYITSGLTASTNLPRPSIPTQTYTIDMNSVVGSTYFVGFTAATGGAAAKFVVPTFYFSTTRFEEGIDVTIATYVEDTLVLTTPTLISSQNNNQPVLTIAVPESSDPSFDRLEYQVDGGAWTTYTQALLLTSGMTIITARGVSLSGRTSSVGSYTLSKIVYNVDNAIDEVVIITSGQGPISLKTTTTSGARIANWYGNSGYTGTAITNASYDSVTTVYGESIFEYTVILSPGHSQATSSITVTYGQALPSGLTPPTQTGYIFQGYFENTNGQGTQYYSSGMVSLTNWTTYSGATLYADWDAATYVVTFENSGVFVSSGNITYDNEYGTLPTVTRTGYNFDGWFTATTGGTEVTSGTVVTITSDQTLYARFTPQTFTVTFNENQGNTPTPTTITVTYDEQYGTLATVDRSGYSFAGWFSGEIEVTENTKVLILDDQILTASWVAEVYTVTFDKQFGTGGSDSTSVTFDAAMPSGLSAPTREGYAFDGYYSSISGGGTKYYDSGMVTVQNWNVAIDTSLYANWIANSYTVTFDSSGISVSAETITVVFASTYGTLPTATRTGYTFNGWFTAATGGTEIGGATSVSIADNHTLFAQWTAESYDVVFDSNFETGTTFIQSIDFDATASLSMNTFIRTGYTFTGWNTQANGQGTPYDDGVSFTMTTVGITLYAQWDAISYNVIFDANQGTGSMSNQSIDFDASAALSSNTFVRTGYTFAGWTTESNGGGDSYANLASFTMESLGVTLYAQWTAVSYNVVFNANLGTGSMNNQAIDFDSEPTLNANSFERVGYTFAGWNTQANGLGVSYFNQQIFRMTTEGITLYAQWTAESYQVVFDNNLGTGAMSNQMINFDATEPLTTNSFERTGFSFTGWNTQADGQGTPYNDGASFTMTTVGITLFAQWTVNNYTVTFNANGGQTPTSTSMTVTFGQSYGTLANVSREGYTFDGWFTQEMAGELVESVTTVSTASHHTLYAYWTANSYEVIFDANDEGQGSGSMNPQSIEYLGFSILSANEFARPSYTFNGWNTEPNGGGVSYANMASFTMNVLGDTLYAQWSSDQFTLTFDSDGGSPISPITQDFGSEVAAPSNPTKTGYSFSGWSPSIPALIPGEDLTITAQWSPNIYDIEFNSNGGTGSMSAQSITFDTSANINSNTFSRSGYRFAGWNTSSNGNGTPYNNQATITLVSNITLYAQWILTEAMSTFVVSDRLLLELDSTNPISHSGVNTLWRNLAAGNSTSYSIVNGSFNEANSSVNFINASGGNGTFVVLSGISIPTGSNYTKEAWVYANSISSSKNIISTNQSPFFVSNGNLSAGVGGAYTLVSYEMPLQAWTHVAVTFDDTNNTMRLYINGKLVDSDEDVTQSFTNQVIRVGAHGNATHTQNSDAYSNWDGQISTVRIYDKALTSNEILQNYNATKTGQGQLNWEFFQFTNNTNRYPNDRNYPDTIGQFDSKLNNRTATYSGSRSVISGEVSSSMHPNLLNWHNDTIQATQFQVAFGKSSLPNNYFVTRLTGYFVPKHSGIYTFSITGDDAVDFVITDMENNTLLTFGHYRDHGIGTLNVYKGTVPLATDTVYKIQIRQQQHTGGLGLMFGWRNPTQNQNWYIDAEELYSTPVNIVHYNSNGRSGTMEQSVVASGQPLVFPTFDFVNQESSSLGWSINDGSTLYAPNDTVVIAANSTLNAQWLDSSYDIQFNANGGTGSITNQSISYNSSANLTLNNGSITRLGHTFDGWNTQADGNGIDYADGASFTMNVLGDTLYAQWTVTVFSISYVLDNGTLTSPINAYTYTSGTVTLPTTITRAYHRFAGWYDNEDFDGSVVTSFESTDVINKTFYAKWIEDATTIIKIPAGKIDASLTNFPLTIVLTDDNFDFNGVQTSGIYFTDANQTLLDFEIESIRVSPRRYIYHVRIPVISHTADTIVNLRVSQEIDYSLGNNPLGVWSENYAFVSHMGSTLKDSTGNVTTFGNNFGTTVVDTPFGDARRFNGTNQYITFDQSGLLTQMNNSSITVVALALLSETPSSTFRLIANTGGGWSRQGFFFATDSTGIRNQMGTGGSETIWYASSLRPSSNQWQLIGMGYNHSTSRQVSYLNTSMETSSSTFGGVYDYRAGAEINIGAGKVADSPNQTANQFVTSARFFKGDLASFRISNVSRSEAWVKAEYFSLTNDLIVFAGRPVVTLVGDSIVDIPINTPYTELGATAKAADGIGNLSNQITTTGTVNSGVLGVYSIEYSVVEAGITASATRLVRVVDITPPTVTLSGSSPFAIPFSATPYTIQDPGLIITDDVDTGLTHVFLNNEFEPVSLESLVTVSTIGDYTVTYVVQDLSGNQTTIQRTFQVRDLTPPVVTLTGASSIELLYGNDYSEPGQSYADDVTAAGSLVKTITYQLAGSGLTNGVHAAIPGTYTITYSATDAAGNTGTAVRTVNITNSFEEFRFTTAGVEGRLGPSLAQLRTAYNPSTYPWINNTSIFNTSNGIQIWTVPVTGTYRIRVAGASGRNINNNVGEGAVMEAEFQLVAGQQLYILVGQQSTTTNTFRDWQGGAGGTFVAFGNSIATANPLIVAGGGGTNRSTATGGLEIMRANTGTSGKNGSGSNGGASGNAASGGGHNQGGGGSAAGFYTNGVKPTDTRSLTTAEINALAGGFSFRNGGNGAYFYSQYSDDQQGDGFLHGAFGGGGPAGWGGTGGGGGYSGGGNDRNTGYSGGGGSFVSATADEVKTSDGSFVVTGTQPTAAYTGTVDNLNVWNTGAGFVEIELAPAPIALIGLDVIEQAFGVPYVDQGVSVGAAASNVNISSGVTQLDTNDNQFKSTPSVNSAVLNAVYRVNYTVTYTEAGQNKSINLTRQITIRDLVAPTVSLNGASSMVVNLGDVFTDPGVSATDDLDQNPQTTITVSILESGLNAQSNIVDTDEIGVYRVTYFVTDASGNQTAITRDVTVIDIAAPVITVTGDTTIYVELGTSYSDSGFTYVDNDSGDFVLTTGITFNGSAIASVNPNQLGTYTYEYTVTDPSGNVGSASRSVIVQDTIAPVITRLGQAVVRIAHGSVYTDSGATVSDVSGSISATVVNPVNTDVVGTYTVTYDAVDPSGNQAIQVTRVVEVFDEVLPLITGVANANINASVTSGFSLPIPTITDNTGNIASSGVEFFQTSGMIPLSDLTQVRQTLLEMRGVTIRYTATDPSDNTRVVDITRTPIDDIFPVFSGLLAIDITTPTIPDFVFPVPQIIDNDPLTTVYSMRARIGTSVFSTDLETVKIAIRDRNAVHLEYTVVDAAGNTTVVEYPINLINFVPIANPEISIALTSGTANIPFSFTYPANPMIDVDFNETLTYTTSGLPPGLSFDAALMTISGTPTLVEGASIEDYTVTLIVTDSQQDSGIRTHVIRVFYTTNITFVSNGGSAVATQTNIIAQPLPAEPIPFLRGYTFEGWFTDSAFTTEFDWDGVMPEVDQTLYAKWSPTVYTITYVDAGSIDGLPATYTVESADITLARPSRTGLIFGGWSDNGFIPQSSIGNRTFTASWIPRTYTLTLIADGRQVSRTSIAFGSSLSSVSLGMPPSRVGYDAVGWNQELPATMPAENITITAVYTIRSFNFTALDDEGNEIARSTVNFNAAVPYPSNPEKEGFTFVRWSVSPATMPASDLTVSAVFEVAEFEVTFVDSEGNNLGSATVAFGAAVTAIEPPEKEGFVFVEWTGLPESMPAAAVTVTAVYEEVVVEEEPEIEETDDEVDDEEDDETTEVAAPVVPTLPNRRPINPIIIPDVILPDNPDPVVTRVSVNGVELDVSIIPGQPVGVLPQPTLPGYNFQGWMNAITGEMITPETIINNPDYVVLVPLFEKAPSLIDAARSVFQALVASSFTVPQTNDFTTRTDNIQSVRGDDANIPAPIPLQRGLQAVFNLNGSVTIPLPKERTPITLRVQGLDALTTEVYYFIGEGAPEFDDPSWRLYTEQPFLSAKQGESVFMMVKDAYDTHQVSYLKPATFVENPERIPTGTVILSLDDDTSLTNTKLNTFLTKIEYEDTMVDLFMFEPIATNDLEQVIVRYRANDHNKSLLISVEAMTWREEIVTLGNSLGVYLRNGDNLTFEVEYQFRGQESVVENFQLTFEGESIGVFLAVSPNSFLRAMLAILILSTLIAPYLVPSTPKQ